MSQRKRDLSISMSAATLYMLAFMIPLLVLFLIPFAALWGLDRFFMGLSRFLEWTSLIPVLVIGVPVHEVIHGAAWVWFGKISFRDIQFGVKSLTPYAHCKVPIQAQAYRMGALMPGLLLGFLPYIVGLLGGNGWFIAFGLVYIFAAGGDLLVLWILRDVDGQTFVEDHPSRAGCYVMEEGRD